MKRSAAVLLISLVLASLLGVAPASAGMTLGPKPRVAAWTASPALASGLTAPETRTGTGAARISGREVASGPLKFLFQGLRSEDVGAGQQPLYGAWYRDADPTTGRWNRRDPGGWLDGPNRYRWNRNNPFRLRDFNGAMPVPNTAAWGGGGTNPALILSGPQGQNWQNPTPAQLPGQSPGGPQQAPGPSTGPTQQLPGQSPAPGGPSPSPFGGRRVPGGAAGVGLFILPGPLGGGADEIRPRNLPYAPPPPPQVLRWCGPRRPYDPPMPRPDPDKGWRIHDDIPDYFPDGWKAPDRRDDLDRLIEDLKNSIRIRKQEQSDFGWDRGHQDRIDREKGLLDRIERWRSDE